VSGGKRRKASTNEASRSFSCISISCTSIRPIDSSAFLDNAPLVSCPITAIQPAVKSGSTESVLGVDSSGPGWLTVSTFCHSVGAVAELL
jgi:hypothetical protein